ncbi:hypothetical protein [Rhodococcus chondri]|uniref:Uncharacterized protein n=1 Tax=Rhodococcus chondri TaxID=3065941 RepID=A0ABU7JPM5_9NOCA|nr:hypothetical protein [Rhodococcus sp. CC-R104]MEE2031986.1 hypothetical protein [Rhodococcus sp. CC-R104]
MAEVVERHVSTDPASKRFGVGSGSTVYNDGSATCIYSTLRIACGAAVTATAPAVLFGSALTAVVTAVLIFAGVVFADSLI